MTKKHFIAMAKAFEILMTEADGPKARDATIDCIEAFMEVAVEANDRFNCARFRDVIGI